MLHVCFVVVLMVGDGAMFSLNDALFPSDAGNTKAAMLAYREQMPVPHRLFQDDNEIGRTEIRPSAPNNTDHWLHSANDLTQISRTKMVPSAPNNTDDWLHSTHEMLRNSQDDDFLSFLSYSYESPFDYFSDETQGASAANRSISTMLAELIHQSTCTSMEDNSSVVCCTFSIDGTSSLSTICTNETTQTKGTTEKYSMRDICPPRPWEQLMTWIGGPILCVFGLCGNTISFVVMCSSSFRRRSYAHYLRALVVFDNLTLIINLIFAVNDGMVHLNSVGEVNATNAGLMQFHTSASCKITEFMRHVVYLMSSWLVVCFTVDRFIAVCFPIHRVRYCTERSAITTIGVALIVIMLSQTYHLVYIERLDGLPMPCHANPSMRLTYFGLNYFWFSFLLRFTLPFLAIAMCNGCIIYRIARMRIGRWAMETRRKQKASLAIYTLYAVCACFVITVLPSAIVAIVQFASYYANERTMDPKLYCTLRTVYTPLHILRLVNYSANFVLYGVAGRQFRKEAYKLLLRCMGRQTPDKRSVQSPEIVPLKDQIILTIRKNGFTALRVQSGNEEL